MLTNLRNQPSKLAILYMLIPLLFACGEFASVSQSGTPVEEDADQSTTTPFLPTETTNPTATSTTTATTTSSPTQEPTSTPTPVTMNLSNIDQIYRVLEIERVPEEISSFQITSHPSRVFLSDKTNTYVWDIHSGEQLFTLEGGTFEKVDLTSNRLVIDHSEQEISLWETYPAFQQIGTIQGRLRAISDDFEKLIVTNAEGEHQVWDLSNLQMVTTFPSLVGNQSSFHFSPGADMVAFREASNPQVVLLDTGTGEILHELPHQLNNAAAMFTSNGSLVTSGGSDENAVVRVWDTSTGEEVYRYALRKTGLWSHFTPDDQYLMIVYFPYRTRMVDLATFELVTELIGVGSPALRSYNPDHTHILADVNPQFLRLYELSSGELIHTLDHGSNERGLFGYWIPNSEVVMGYAFSNPLIKFWDSNTGLELHTMDIGHELERFTADVNGLFFATYGATIQVWSVPQE